MAIRTKAFRDLKQGDVVNHLDSTFRVVIPRFTGKQEPLFQESLASGIWGPAKRWAEISPLKPSSFALVSEGEPQPEESAGSSLTASLLEQKKKNDLTESLRNQQDASESYSSDEDDYYSSDEDEESDWEDDEPDWGDDEEEEEEDDEQDEEEQSSRLLFSPQPSAPVYYTASSVSAGSLANDLKLQQHSHDIQAIKESAVIDKLNTASIKRTQVDLADDVQELFSRNESFYDEVHELKKDLGSWALDQYDTAQDVSQLTYRVEKIEQDKKREEEKVNNQDRLNQALAKNKAQAGMQDALNQKLNQKSGGNGSMKKLLGNAFNFGKVEGKFAFSPVTGGLALRKDSNLSEFIAYNKDSKELTDVSGLTLKFDVPAFKLPVAAAQIAVGDLVIHNGEYVYVTKKADGYLETLNPEKAVRGSVVPTKNALLGAAFYTVVKTLDAAGQGGFNPMLLMALDKGSDKNDLLPLLLASGGIGNGSNGSIDPMMFALLGDDTEDLLPLVLMQQGGATNGDFNPLMFLAMNKGGKSKELLPLLMMQQGGAAGGAGQINPMMLMALAGDGDIDFTTLALMGGLNGQGGLFGQAPAEAKQEVVAPVAPVAPEASEEAGDEAKKGKKK